MRVEQVIEQRLGWFDNQLISVVTLDVDGTMIGWVKCEPIYNEELYGWLFPTANKGYSMGKIYNCFDGGRDAYYEVKYK